MMSPSGRYPLRRLRNERRANQMTETRNNKNFTFSRRKYDEKGSAARLPLPGADTDDESPREGDVARLHDGVRRDVGRLARRDGQRAAPGGDDIDIPVCMRELFLPFGDLRDSG